MLPFKLAPTNAPSGPDFATWTQRTPTAVTTVDLFSVTSNGSLFVAVGTNGTTLSSPDGLTWTTRLNMGVGNTFYDVIWTGSEFVAVGGAATGVLSATSSDGITWYTNISTGITGYLNKVAYSNTYKFVAVGGAGLIVTGSFAGAWTKRTSGVTGIVTCVTWTGSYFVAMTQSGQVLSSQSGVIWALGTSASTSRMEQVEWMNGKLVAVGNGVFQTSTSVSGANGTWTVKGTSGNSVVWDGQKYFGLGGSSLDGATWVDSDTGITSIKRDITLAGGRFVIVGNAGAISTSTDGVNWTVVSSVFWQGGKRAAYSPTLDLFAFAGSGGTIITYKPPSFVLSGRVVGSGRTLYGVRWLNDRFVAFGVLNELVYSTDGVNWTQRTVSNTNGVGDVAWNGSVYVAVGGSGTVWVAGSTMSSWPAYTTPTTSALSAVVWTGSQFVAVGSAVASLGVILTSPNGYTWTSRTSNTTRNITGVAWSGSKLVAVTAYGEILTSTDGITWVNNLMPTPVVALNDIEYLNGMFVAVGNTGAVITSTDGVTWTRRSTGKTDGYLSVTASPSSIAISNGSIVITNP